jgi:hypothetical protein
MADIDDEIRSRTEVFATDVAVLVRRMALEAVETALLGSRGTVAAPPVKVAAKRGRPPKALAVATPRFSATPAPRASAQAPVSRRPAPQRVPGEKRPPAELAKLVEKLGEYIKGHPGLRMEAIGKALGLPTRELNLPVKKLLAARRIRSEGHKRATEYYPA